MVALTLKHPWPYCVAILGKDVENRFWSPSPRQLRPGQWFLIHGGKAPTGRDDLTAIASVVRGLHADFGHRAAPRADVTLGDVLAFSGIVAACRFDGVCTPDRPSASPWYEGDGFGWLLGRTVVLPEPVPCRGSQGLWSPPPDVLAAALAQLSGLGVPA